jgi:hypothetical protein
VKVFSWLTTSRKARPSQDSITLQNFANWRKPWGKNAKETCA